MPLEKSAASLSGVGPSIGERLARLGVETIGDLLFLLPLRYEDRTEIRRLGSLRPGERALIEGEIALSEVAYRRRRMLLCRLVDGTGAITLRFFHFSKRQQDNLTRGKRLRCFGEVRAGPTGIEMVHPEYRAADDTSAPEPETLTPIYPTTEGLQQARLRALVDQGLAVLEKHAPEDLLAELLATDAPPLTEALRHLHRPPRESAPELTLRRNPYRRRLALEELIAHRLSLKARAAQNDDGAGAPQLALSDRELTAFRSALEFELTGAQLRVVAEILGDLDTTRPMNRLLQGDVGSGKTVVAACAMYAAAHSGYQAALMAPTEILAEQHFLNLSAWLAPLNVDVAFLSGSQTAANRRNELERIQSGRARVAVGTHALFQDAVNFDRLGLVVVDEQHRFGVEQRLKLRQKGAVENETPHQLIMTATPIPRTLAMTAYADLDCSIIDELPRGRLPIKTVALPESRRPELVERVGKHCTGGSQAYWVCPLIEDSESLEASAAEALTEQLGEALPGVKLGLIHGRMKGIEKDAVMRSFKEGRLQLLVATTVIEVGVDVPNASLMIVENAERMGLAQLHQLRGRVGRGQVRSNCVLLYKPPLSQVARERLEVMRASTDGFVIAEKDLELRGPGEVLGTRQTGVQQMRIADLELDYDLLPEVVRITERIESRWPERVAPLLARWIKSGVEYANV